MSHRFHFAVDLAGGASPEMIHALAVQVLGHVGCPAEDAGSVAAALENAVAQNQGGGADRAAPPAPLRVEFRADGGSLEVEVTAGVRRIWQASRPIS